MTFENALCNKPIPSSLLPLLTKAVQNEVPHIVLIGDLFSNATYGNTALVITDSRVLCVEENASDEVFSLPLTEVHGVKVRRMYGNAVLRLNHRTVFRCTFATIAILEAVVAYLNAIRNGDDRDTAKEVVQIALDKERAVCPKCGRALLRPGAECINCMSKSHLFKRLWGYMRPQRWMLLGCIFLSMLTTAMALVPPYVTKTLVDNVIPNKDYHGLLMLVGVLLVPWPLLADSVLPGESVVLAGFFGLEVVLVSLFIVIADITGTDCALSFSAGFASLYAGGLAGALIALTLERTGYAIVVLAGAIILLSYLFLFTERDFDELSQLVTESDTRDSFETACAEIAETYGLSNRESEILAFALRGRTSERIAQELVISKSTVDTHLRRIYSKCGVHSRQELLDLAERRS